MTRQGQKPWVLLGVAWAFLLIASKPDSASALATICYESKNTGAQSWGTCSDCTWESDQARLKGYINITCGIAVRPPQGAILPNSTNLSGCGDTGAADIEISDVSHVVSYVRVDSAGLFVMPLADLSEDVASFQISAFAKFVSKLDAARLVADPGYPGPPDPDSMVVHVARYNAAAHEFLSETDFYYEVPTGPTMAVASPGVVRGRMTQTPNPFRSFTTVDFDLAKPSSATVDVFDAAGRRIASIFSGRLDGGRHRFGWDGRGADGSTVAGGVYFCVLEVEGAEARVSRAVRIP